MKFFWIYILLLTVSCHSLKGGSANIPPTRETPTIIFLNYTVSRDSDSDLKIHFVSKLLTSGKFKDQGANLTPIRPNDLKIVQLSNTFSRIDSLLITNPLERNIEYIDPNGNFALKHVSLDSTEFSLRIQLNPRADYITIEKVNQPGISYQTTKL